MDKREAEKTIEAVLRQLEVSTGTVVTGVYILATDLTGIDGSVDRLRRIQLETTPQPGDGWEG